MAKCMAMLASNETAYPIKGAKGPVGANIKVAHLSTIEFAGKGHIVLPGRR